MWEANVKAKHTRRNPPPRLSSSTSHPILFALRFSPFFFNVSVPLSPPSSLVPRQPEPAENNSSPRTKGGFVVTFLRAPFPLCFHKEFVRIVRGHARFSLSLSLSFARFIIVIACEHRKKTPITRGLRLCATSRLFVRILSSKQSFRDRTSRFIVQRNGLLNARFRGNFREDFRELLQISIQFSINRERKCKA